MPGRVAGKVALVTGAARGQGRAHAERLAAEGAAIIGVDLCAPVDGVAYPPATTDDLQETADLVEKHGSRMVPVVCDIRDLAVLRSAVDDAVGVLGGLDVVVANAGVAIAATWDAVTPENVETTLGVNVVGTWNTVMVGAPHLVRKQAGSIILISSATALSVAPFLLPYVTSKFAVRGMAKAFAAELARHNIRVNSVHPTGVPTPMAGPELRSVLDPALDEQPNLRPMFANMLPVRSVGVEDIADTVLFLASDESRYITAHELAPDAGASEL